MSSKGRKERFPGLDEALKYAGLGLQLVAALLLYLVVGYFGDRWLGTTPWLTILGALVGFVAMGAMLYRISKQADRDSKARRAARSSGEAR